ncbi:MAG: hypothetical protein NT166_14615 [Candidatus Aminicenantes bacterium]|nr:hypothetical protein [Candidatus Aminicenantes bacterium]
MNHIEFYRRIAGKYGAAPLHRRRFPLLVYLSFNRKTGETTFRPPFILERNITVLSRILNRVFHFHRHLHFNFNVLFRENKAYFHSTLPANQVRFFPRFPMFTSHYHRDMYSVANTHAPIFQSFPAGNSTNMNSQSLLPPAGQNPFEKGFRHLPKLLLMKSFWQSGNRPLAMVSKKSFWRPNTTIDDGFRTNQTFQTVDNRRNFVFPRSPVFQGPAARMLMKETTHAERVMTYRQTESTGAAFSAPGGGGAQPHIGRSVVDKHFTRAPGAATAAAAAATAAEAEAAPTAAAAATAAYTTPAVLIPLTARTPLTSLAPLTPLTSQALAHIPTIATAARSHQSEQSQQSDLSNLSNRSELSDRFRGKRPETPTIEHPRPGPGPGAGARKTAPRSLEAMARYDDAALAASAAGKASGDKIINETISTHPGKTQVFSPPEVDLHRLTDQVYRMLEKKIKMERERRGW